MLTLLTQARSVSLEVYKGGMQLWFSRGSGVPLREQMVTQIVLGILSGDLAPGERLPSTRELARRFHLHPNTASAGYRKLERDGWVEARHGSGVYVRDKPPSALVSPDLRSGAVKPAAARVASRELELDQLVAAMFESARRLGVGPVAVRARLRRWLAVQPPDHFLLIEPDPALRGIVLAEMGSVLRLPIVATEVALPRLEELSAGLYKNALPSGSEDADVVGVGGRPSGLGSDSVPDGKTGLGGKSGPGSNFGSGSYSATGVAGIAEGAIAVVLPSKAEMVRRLLRPETELVVLQVRSIRSSLAEYLPARVDALIAVASEWKDFLTLAHTMLVAAGFDADGIVLRYSGEAGWRDGLDEVAAVICDSLTAGELAGVQRGLAKGKKRPVVIPFRLLAESSLEELRRCEELILQSHLSVSSEAESRPASAPDSKTTSA